jgi:hypothetical protein
VALVVIGRLIKAIKELLLDELATWHSARALAVRSLSCSRRNGVQTGFGNCGSSEFEEEQLQEEKAKTGKWPNPYVTPKATVGPYVTPKVSAEDHSPEDQAQAQRDADSAKALLEATNRRALAAEVVERASNKGKARG